MEAVGLHQDLTLEDVTCVMKFYLSVIQPLMRKYASWALGNLASRFQIQYDRNSDCLGVTKGIRLLRALYRFQLCCNLFSHSYNGPIFKPAHEYEGWDVWGLLKSVFPPWEIEEIVCIHEFVMQTYRTTSPIRWNWQASKYHQQP